MESLRTTSPGINEGKRNGPAHLPPASGGTSVPHRSERCIAASDLPTSRTLACPVPSPRSLRFVAAQERAATPQVTPAGRLAAGARPCPPAYVAAAAPPLARLRPAPGALPGWAISACPRRLLCAALAPDFCGTLPRSPSYLGPCLR
jgi:hypothetical protein